MNPFIRYTGKTNNQKFLGRKKINGVKQDTKNPLMLHMSEAV